jgi:hypothetical protein
MIHTYKVEIHVKRTKYNEIDRDKYYAKIAVAALP